MLFRSVNSAMEEAITVDLPDISTANDDAEIRVAIMQFSSGCSWITPSSGPIGIGDVIWNDLHPSGLTDLGAACVELDKKLSRNEFLESQTGAYAPVILLFSDGGPTDNWEKGLEQLKKNNWFKHAIKIAIAIGEDADKTVLATFTGTPESVIAVNDKHTLKALIRKVSVRASEFQSHSKQASDIETTPEEDSAKIVQDVKTEISQEANTDGGPIKVDDSGWGDW